jgi:AcrR family transcriptional regulator
MSATKIEGSARERLLSAANELFYEEGVHTVGIDRVIERAGVAKASLYSTFGSKEELVLAYLGLRAETRKQRILARIAQHEDPREKILAVFGLLNEIVREPTFRGCAFVNACAEGSRTESRISEASLASRAWTRRMFVELAQAAGAAEGDRLGRRFSLLYDGAIISASVDKDVQGATEAIEVARLLIDTQIPAKHKKSSPRGSKASGSKALE